MIGVGLVGVHHDLRRLDQGLDQPERSTAPSPATSSSTSGAGVMRRRSTRRWRRSWTGCPRCRRDRAARTGCASVERQRHGAAHRRSTRHRVRHVRRRADQQGSPAALGAGHHRRLRGRGAASKGLTRRRHGPGGVQGHRPAAAHGRDDLRRGLEANGPVGTYFLGHAGLRRPTSPTTSTARSSSRRRPASPSRRRCAAVDDGVAAVPRRHGAGPGRSSRRDQSTRR